LCRSLDGGLRVIGHNILEYTSPDGKNQKKGFIRSFLPFHGAANGLEGEATGRDGPGEGRKQAW